MPDEPREATAEEVREEEERRRFEWEAAYRQSNVLPLDSARNEGRFYGLLAKGSLELSAPQRIGALLVGILWLAPGAWGVGLLWSTVAAVKRRQPSVHWENLAFLPICVLSLWLGLEICRAGFFAPRRRRSDSGAD